MNTNTRYHWLVVMVSVAVLSLACNYLARITNPAAQKSGPEDQVPQPEILVTPPPQVPAQGEITPQSGQEKKPTPAQAEGSMALIRQWASEAIASSAYGEESWAALQATGEPNTPECGDIETAWASASSNTREWLVLYYPKPVYAVEVNIYQTYNPDQVIGVDLIDLQGRFVNVYKGKPRQIETCPYILNVPTAFSGVLAQGVQIIIDQSILELGWNEIDAVEMVGAPGEGTPVRPTLP